VSVFGHTVSVSSRWPLDCRTRPFKNLLALPHLLPRELELLDEINVPFEDVLHHTHFCVNRLPKRAAPVFILIFLVALL
jgi:hypothetical protein